MFSQKMEMAISQVQPHQRAEAAYDGCRCHSAVEELLLDDLMKPEENET